MNLCEFVHKIPASSRGILYGETESHGKSVIFSLYMNTVCQSYTICYDSLIDYWTKEKRLTCIKVEETLTLRGEQVVGGATLGIPFALAWLLEIPRFQAPNTHAACFEQRAIPTRHQGFAGVG